MTQPGISIIIPTWNEAESIDELVTRVGKTLAQAQVPYELIFVDDHSTDRTVSAIERYRKNQPIQVYTKKGKQGKAYSILEGVTYAQYPLVAMLDADLQYPPEIIPQMIPIATAQGVAVANRKTYKTSLLRRVSSRTNAFIFGRLLLGLKTDIQSGLKVFRKDIAAHIDQRLVHAWSLDIPLLFTAKELGYTIGHVDIDFAPRPHGSSKVNVFMTALQIVHGALRTKLQSRRVYEIQSETPSTMRGAGVAHKGVRFITHTTLPHRQGAFFTLQRWQKWAILLLVAAIATGALTNPYHTAIALVGTLSAIYFVDVLFNLYLILKSLYFPPEIDSTAQELGALGHSSLPVYSIMCPLYKEAHVLPQFVAAIEQLDYPHTKLDVMLLLESDDQETIVAARHMELPAYMRIVVVPQSQPKTKPKACNYGLTLAKGDYIVIYDAEDMPDPQQLKKAYCAFGKVPAATICLQAKLNYYNPHHNLLTRLFTAEYSLWFDVVLTGLQSIETSIPLGGTSNHFRTRDLVKLGGWDPFNVTEDCDLGIRLFKAGYKTAIIDSTTLEEANSQLFNWIRQRSRWIKGYIQTYFVHMRHPVQFVRRHGIHALIFQLVVGGKIAFMLINPLLWVATIAYFTLYAIVGPTIESLYPTIVFYMAATSLVFGNFFCIYYYMIGCAKRGHWALLKYVYLVPLYWLLVSIAAAKALLQLIFHPHYWEKTVHGYHLQAVKPTAFARFASSRGAAIRKKLALLRALLGTNSLVGGGVLISSSMIGNILNFAYNAYLGRAVSVEEFGLVSLIGSLLLLSSIPMSALSKTIIYQSAYLLGKYNTQARSFWTSVRTHVFWVAIAATACWIGATPLLAHFFRSASWEPFLLFAPVWFTGTYAAVDKGFLLGNLSFTTIATLVVSEATIKLVFAWFFVTVHAPHYVYAAVPLSMMITFLFAWYFAKRIARRAKPEPSLTKQTRFPIQFLITSVATKISGIAFLSFDVILVKHFLAPTPAGQYALLALVGKMIFYLGDLFGQFMTPVVAKREGAASESTKAFYRILAASLLTSTIAYIAVGLLGNLTVPLLFGSKTQPILSLLPLYGFAMVAYTIANSIVSFYQIRKKHIFPAVSVGFALLEVVGISLYHANLPQVVLVVTAVGVLYMVMATILHGIHEQVLDQILNLYDLTRTPQQPATETGSLRILIFNWRDTKHVWAGGAEVYLHEIAKVLVQKGHAVTLFCGNDGRAPRTETLDGINFVRRGGFFTVYLWAYIYYRFRFKGKFDVILDSENGIPFFTPLYAADPVVGLIYHVHQDVFRKHLLFPLAQLAMFLEAKVTPRIYRTVPLVTISNSSKHDMIKTGLGKEHNIQIVSPGIDPTRFKPATKSTAPSILYLGRLQPYKSIDTIIKALPNVIKHHAQIDCIIAGAGESRDRLQKLVQKLGLSAIVQFVGKVDEHTKARLYAQAWVMVQPSLVEGWGMTVIEANASGTPVVAANVPGLRDSVLNPHTGFLVPWGDSRAFADKINALIANDKLRTDLARGGIAWAKKFSWEQSATLMLEILKTRAQKETAL